MPIYKTTAACPSFAYVAQENANVIQRLLNDGAILIGKTNLDQFATGLVGVRSPYGACSNLFNPEYISGGSSSGSALAVAAGLVSFALGTDTAGSGRVPAAFANIVGLKPTKGALRPARSKRLVKLVNTPKRLFKEIGSVSSQSLPGFVLTACLSVLPCLGPAFSEAGLFALAKSYLESLRPELGAIKAPYPVADPGLSSDPAPSDGVMIAVVGAHLTGEPLNHQLVELDARFIERTKTAPLYRLFALRRRLHLSPVCFELVRKAALRLIWKFGKFLFPNSGSSYKKFLLP
jgi:Amidase/Allophanate hydrolase C-terminal domain